MVDKSFEINRRTGDWDMSDISITGNEAHFNENVTFLKDVNIGGFLTLPRQE